MKSLQSIVLCKVLLVGLQLRIQVKLTGFVGANVICCTYYRLCEQ